MNATFLSFHMFSNSREGRKDGEDLNFDVEMGWMGMQKRVASNWQDLQEIKKDSGVNWEKLRPTPCCSTYDEYILCIQKGDMNLC